MTGRIAEGRRGGAVGRSLGFRSDIQGLRAFAIVLVVVYHFWPDVLSGGYIGLDVFFVISGYLMTAMLLKHPPRRSRGFARFWAHRIRRLLPAALLVIAVTGIATHWLAPSPVWLTTARQALASTLFVQNWLLAATGVDDQSIGAGASPLEHFWALSVAEQSCVLWPFVMAAALWWAVRRRREDSRGAVLAAMSLLLVASLVVSVWWTAVAPSPAFLLTPTRLWELALGGLIAALPDRGARALPPAARSGLPWLGLTAIVTGAVWFTTSTPFPGYAALLPATGTALVLYCRPVGDRTASPGRMLALRPVQYLGNISYSVYLWHWPIIALLPYVSGPLGILDKIVALVATVALGDLTRSAVEDPFRRVRTRRAQLNTYRFGAAGTLVVAVAAGLWLNSVSVQVYGAEQPISSVEAHAGPCFGAASMAKGFAVCPQDDAATPFPAPKAAARDKSVAYRDNCWVLRPYTAQLVCRYGDGPVQVALVGNTGYWLPALMKLAQARNWTITTYLSSRCVPSDTRQQFETAELTENCYDYGQWVLDQTAHGQYDLIIATNRESVKAAGQSSWTDSARVSEAGFRSYLQRWAAGGTPIVVLHDLPYPGKGTGDIPACLTKHAGHVDRCAGTPQSWGWHYPFTKAAQGITGVQTVDMTRYFCTATVCPAVIGGVSVYFDSSHMTATYARSLAPYLADELDKLHLG